MTNTAQRNNLLATIPWLLGPLFFGCLALYLGQDANWDLRNYHFYNAYSFLFHRLDFDVLPAQVATFYNPLLYVPFYKLVMAVPPKVVGFVLGAVQGLNFPLLVGIIRCVLDEDSSLRRYVYPVAAAGVLGAANISEVGTMFADNLTSLLILSSLWLFVANYRMLTERRMFHASQLLVFGGFLMGAAMGFKQPAAIFAVGWCIAFLILPVSFLRRVLLSFFFGVGVLAGFAATGGYWMYRLWTSFANPLFPYFNRFFHSPMAALADYRDIQHLPDGFWNALLFPFSVVANPFHTGEVAFRDLRFAVFAVVAAGAVLYSFYRLLKFRRLFAEDVKIGSTAERIRYSRLFLLTGGLVAYAVWLKLFGIYRYLVPVEFLTPLGILLVVDTYTWRQKPRDAVVVGCLVLIMATLQPGNWGRVAWGKTYFGVEPPKLDNPDQTMILLAGMDPTAYLIPFFPQNIRFVRIQGYFTHPGENASGFDRLMHDLVDKHQGPLYVIFRSNEAGMGKDALRTYGLAVAEGGCTELHPHIEEHVQYPLDFCTVERVDSSKTKENKE